MEKAKSLMDKDISFVERSFLTDVFIAKEMTRRMEAGICAWGKERGYLVGAEYSPKRGADSDR